MNAPKLVPLSAIKIDGGTQTRVRHPEPRIREYVECLLEGDEFPPIVLFFDGIDHWLADGFTRYFAHKRAEKAEILAEVRQGDQRDALQYALGANAKHGEPRTAEDKRKAVTIALEDPQWSQLTDQAVADLCKVSRGLVNNVRRELAGKPPSPSRQKASDRTPEPTPEPEEEIRDGKPDDETTPDPRPEPNKQHPRDGLGIEITDQENARRFEQARLRATVARRALQEARKAIDDLCQGPGGEHLAVAVGAKMKKGEVSYKCHHVTQAIDRLRDNTPFASVCPYCYPGQPKKGCTPCKGLGYVTLIGWKQAPDEFKTQILTDHGIEGEPSEEVE